MTIILFFIAREYFQSGKIRAYQMRMDDLGEIEARFVSDYRVIAICWQRLSLSVEASVYLLTRHHD
jgi:hypothetical protein